MPISVRFDAQGFYEALKEHMIKVMNDLNQSFYKEATGGLSSDDSEIEGAVISGSSEAANASGTEYITAKCRFYTDAILESFGIGSKADTGPESYWAEYTQSAAFNPKRSGSTIVGRAKETETGYTDIWGNERVTSGRNAGKRVEGYPNAEGVIITPRDGTRSIQRAEAFFFRDGETRAERRIQEEIEQFFAENASNFFIVSG